MDGTDAKVLFEVAEPNSISGLATDHTTLYWTEWSYNQMLQCDLDGKNLQRLSFSPHLVVRGAVVVLDKVAYWLEREMGELRPSLFRAATEDHRAELVLSATMFTNLAIIPSSVSRDSSSDNPCRNNPCSQICVRSGHKHYTCLCGDDYVFHQDGHNCTGQKTT